MKRRPVFRSSVVVPVLTVLLIFFSGIAFLFAARTHTLNILLAEVKSQSELAAGVLERDYKSALPIAAGTALSDVGTMLSTLHRFTSSDITLCSPDGTVVLACGEVSAPALDPGTVELVERKSRESGFAEAGLFPEPNAFGAAGIYYGGELAGIIVFSCSIESTNIAFGKIIAAFVLLTLISLAVCFFLTLRAAGRNHRSLLNMSAFAGRLSMGDYSARLPIDSREAELGELSRSLNSTADALARQEQLRVDFIQNISHEFKTPMTSVTGFIDALIDDVVPPERYKSILETIQREIKRMGRLLTRMLDVSKLQAGGMVIRLRRIDIGELIAVTLLSFEQKMNRKGMNVSVELPEPGIRVLGDPDALSQVLFNLIDNSVKHGSERLWVSVVSEGERAKIVIGNNGTTIPESELRYIFDRFHKLDRSRSADRDGFGLGLYIVRSILRAHGEEINVQSEGGVTTFTFYLPTN